MVQCTFNTILLFDFINLKTNFTQFVLPDIFYHVILYVLPVSTDIL